MNNETINNKIHAINITKNENMKNKTIKIRNKQTQHGT